MDLIAEPPLRPDAEAVTDDQHPDHQFRINRRPTRPAVERRQFTSQPGEVDEAVGRPEQVVSRHVAVERELVEERVLLDLPRTHHLLRPRLSAKENQRASPGATAEFFNEIDPWQAFGTTACRRKIAVNDRSWPGAKRLCLVHLKSNADIDHATAFNGLWNH